MLSDGNDLEEKGKLVLERGLISSKGLEKAMRKVEGSRNQRSVVVL